MNIELIYSAIIPSPFFQKWIPSAYKYIFFESNPLLFINSKGLYLEITNLFDKKVLKGTTWLLLKNPENLDDSKNERLHLQHALQINKPLATAYYMKEDLRLLWLQENKKEAEKTSKPLDRKSLLL